MTEPPVSSADSGTVDAGHPWLGLAAFREVDQDFFFGREEEAEELQRLVQRERLTVLYGLSGLGKTSLLQAGLFPRLRREDILPVPIRIVFSEDHRNLIDQVREAISSAAAAARVEAPPLPKTETLWESLHRKEAEFWGPRTRLNIPLLVFDQFEEVFTLGRRSAELSRETGELLIELAALAEGAPPPAFSARAEADPTRTRELSLTRHPYKILFSLREDFLADLDSLRGQFRSAFHNRLRLRRMNGESALRVVAQPGPLLIAPEVAERVVRFVAGQEEKNRERPLPELEVEPALLSFVCRELNKHRGGAPISADLLQGSRDEIFSKFYEDSLHDQAPQLRTFIEDHLLTKSGFRDSMALENARDLPGVSQEAIDKLVERRLLRIEDRGGRQRLELTHDVLTDVVRARRDNRRREEALEQEAATRREEEGRALQARRARELRRTRWLLALCATLLLGCIGLFVTAYRAKREALQLLAASDVQVALKAAQPQEALAWFAHALRQDPESLEARSMLFSALLGQSWLLPIREIPLREDEIKDIEMSPDGRIAAVLNKNKEVRILDLDAAPTAERIVPGVNSMRITPDSQRLVTWSSAGLRLWDLRTGLPIGVPISGGVDCLGQDCRIALASAVDGVHFLETATGRESGPPISLPDAAHWRIRGAVPLFLWTEASTGDVILVLDEKNNSTSILVHDIRSGRTIGPPLLPSRWTKSVAISPDGRLLFAVTDKGVQVWDGQTHAHIAFLPHPQPPELIQSEPAGRLVTSGPDHMIRVWDATRGALLAQIRSEESFSRFHLSQDGRTLLAVTFRGDSLLSWDLKTGSLLYQPFAGAKQFGLRENGASLRVAAVVGSDTLRVFSPTQEMNPVFAEPASRKFDDVRFSPDANLIAYLDDFLTVRDTATGQIVGKPIALSYPYSSRLHFVAGQGLALIERDEVLFWSFQTGKIRQVPLVMGGLNLKAVSRDGTKAIFVSDYPDVHGMGVDLLSGKSFPPYPSQMLSNYRIILGFSPDGEQVLFPSTESTLQIFETRTAKLLAKLIHPEKIVSAAFIPDSSSVFTVAADGAIRLWEANSGRQSRIFTSDKRFRRAYLTPDDRSLLTVDGENKVRLLDLRSGRLMGKPIAASSDYAQLSPDGRRVLLINSVRGGESAQFWDTLTGRALGEPFFMLGYLSQSTFSLDGKRLLLASTEQVLSVDLPFGSAADADLLSRWAEAIGGLTVDPSGDLTPVPDQVARLDALRRETAKAPWGRDEAASLIRWFFADPSSRPRSPLSSPPVNPP